MPSVVDSSGPEHYPDRRVPGNIFRLRASDEITMRNQRYLSRHLTLVSQRRLSPSESTLAI